MNIDYKSIDSFNTFMGILDEMHIRPPIGSEILDLGCGQGGLLRQLLQNGYNGFGTDLTSYGYKIDADLSSYFKPILETPYTLPFKTASFDYVLTNQVVEHVRNINDFFNEISRILKPGGISVNIFPSKYRLIEPHIKVPFAGLLNSYNYFLFCAILGLIINQKLNDFKLKAITNHNYIKTRTNYLSTNQYNKILKNQFSSVEWIGQTLITNGTGRANQYLQKAVKYLPFIGNIYGKIHTHVLLLRK